VSRPRAPSAKRRSGAAPVRKRDRVRQLWLQLRAWYSAARTAVRRVRLRLPQPVRWLLRRGTRFSLHAVNGVLITIVLLFVAAYLWLPTLAARKAEIELYVGQAVGNPVRFDQLETFWDGLNPGVRVQGFQVKSAATGETAASLREVRLSLAWWPLLTGRIEIGTLLLVEPNLALERAADGRLRVTGIEMQGGADPALQGFSEWLLRQQEMIIENGTLEWVDRMNDAGTVERLAVRRVFLALRNDGDRHQFDVRADFPAAVCVGCRFSADFTGQPFVDRDWSGTIRVQARELVLQALPRALRTLLPAGVDGRVRLDLISDWRRGRPVVVEGRLGAQGLSLPLTDGARAVTLQRFDTDVDWRGSAEAGRLELDNLSLGLTREPWRAGRLQLAYGRERFSAAVERIDIADLAAFAARLEHDNAVMRWVRAAQPLGTIEDAAVELDGPVRTPRDYRIEAQLRSVGFTAVDRVPGLSALSGRLRVTPAGGEFALASGAGRIDLPRVFEEALEVDTMASRIRWRRADGDWLVQADDIVLTNDDGRAEGELELRLPVDPTLSPVIRLQATVRDGDAAHTGRYLPRILPPALRAYLGDAVVAGRVSEASVLLQGALRNFPFRDGNGRFEVHAHVEDGVFRYLPGWTALESIDADLRFTGTDMLIAGRSGRIGALRVGRTTVAIADFKAPDGPMVQVASRMTGPLADSLKVLADSKSPAFSPWLVPGLEASGDGVLALAINLPLRTLKPAIDGYYRLVDNALTLPFRDLRAEALRGAIEFTEAGLRGGTVQGRFLGGDSGVEFKPGAAGGVRAEAHGLVTQDGLTKVFGPAVTQLVRGQVPWTAQVDLDALPASLSAQADLRDLELRLPAPLAKAHGEPLMLLLRPIEGGSGTWLLDLEAGGRATGRLAFVRRDGRWQFDRGQIGLAERVTSLPARDGLTLSARLASLNVDRWWQFLRADLDTGSGSGWREVIRHVSAEVDALEAFGRPFGQLRVDLDHDAGRWQGRMQGEAIAGTAMLTEPDCRAGQRCTRSQERPVISLNLARLALPPAPVRDEPQRVDPYSLPTLAVKSAAFAMDGRNYGALDFRAVPATRGWRIETLQLTQPYASFKLTGLWEADDAGGQMTTVDVSLQASDSGRLLADLGYSNEVVGGKLLLTSRAAWPGAPAEFALATLDGRVNISFSDGRLPQVSPGAGRLLGVLDLGSLVRYLSFDFSQVFGKGLTFDSMRGSLQVAAGSARTDGFRIRTPAAEIDLTGRIGLVDRDLDLEMGVTPRLLEELAVTGGLIGGPAVGAAVALLHNLVKKPLEKGTRIGYTVTGSWQLPVVKRIPGPAVESALTYE